MKFSNKYIIQKRFENSKALLKMHNTIYNIKDDKEKNLLEGKRIIEKSSQIFNFRDALRNHETEIYDNDKRLYLKTIPSYRINFAKYSVLNESKKQIGVLKEQLFIFFFRRRFKILDSNGDLIMKVRSDFWLKRSFTVKMKGKLLAKIDRKWRGTKREALQYDNYYHIEILDDKLDKNTRKFILASGIFIDQIWGTKPVN